MAPERFEFDIALTTQDYRTYLGGSGGNRIPPGVLNVAAAIVVGAASILASVADGPVRTPTAAFVAVVGALAFEAGWCVRALNVRRGRPRPRADGAIDSFHLVVDATGIRTVHPTREWLTRWAGYETLEASAGALVVRGKSSRAAIIPRRCIASPADAERLERFIRARLAAAALPLRAKNDV